MKRINERLSIVEVGDVLGASNATPVDANHIAFMNLPIWYRDCAGVWHSVSKISVSELDGEPILLLEENEHNAAF